MSILTRDDRRDLVYAMRKSLLGQVRESKVLTESKRAAAENFILNEATYEQMLNLVWNPERETNYKPVEVLEKVALESYKQFLDAETKPETKSEVKPVKEAAVIEESKFGVIEETFKERMGKIWQGTKAAPGKVWAATKAAPGKVVKAVKATPGAVKAIPGAVKADVGKAKEAFKAAKTAAAAAGKGKIKSTVAGVTDVAKKALATKRGKVAAGLGLAATAAAAALAARRARNKGKKK
jgi:hypothetical protein